MQQYMDATYSALLEGRFLFDFVHEDRLQLERIKKYSAIILPNTALLSDEQCRQLREYVDHGGSLLATFETSMFNERNERRDDFGLADVFGIHAAGPVIGRPGNANSYMARIERQHPILDGFADTHWIAGSEFRLPLKPVDDPVLTVVPGLSPRIRRSFPIRPFRTPTSRPLFCASAERGAWPSSPATSSQPCGSRAKPI